MLSSFDVFRSLKTGTWNIHQQIEQRTPIFDPAFELADYVRLLERFYGFWTPLEIKLSQIPDLRDPVLDLPGRLKSHLLQADLRFLGSDPTLLPHCRNLPATDTFERGLGSLYVLEGSTLGGQLISRRIDSHLNLRNSLGGSFFYSYGETVGQRWSEFRSFMTAHATPANSVEIVNAARQTFECLFEWLGTLSKPEYPEGL